MASEIISSWDSILDLVRELRQTDPKLRKTFSILEDNKSPSTQSLLKLSTFI